MRMLYHFLPSYDILRHRMCCLHCELPIAGRAGDPGLLPLGSRSRTESEVRSGRSAPGFRNLGLLCVFSLNICTSITQTTYDRSTKINNICYLHRFNHILVCGSPERALAARSDPTDNDQVLGVHVSPRGKNTCRFGPDRVQVARSPPPRGGTRLGASCMLRLLCSSCLFKTKPL